MTYLTPQLKIINLSWDLLKYHLLTVNKITLILTILTIIIIINLPTIITQYHQLLINNTLKIYRKEITPLLKKMKVQISSQPQMIKRWTSSKVINLLTISLLHYPKQAHQQTDSTQKWALFGKIKTIPEISEQVFNPAHFRWLTSKNFINPDLMQDTWLQMKTINFWLMKHLQSIKN